MKKKPMRILLTLLLVAVLTTAFSMTAFAAGDVAGAIESTWNAAKGQIQTVVNNVVFPFCDMILAILFFVKIGTAYFDYRKHGQFEFAAPCILFACLIFTLTAPLYIWSII
ncbi:MAG: DUF3852 domain-containing protein [Oscillospiraceae bacterium]